MYEQVVQEINMSSVNANPSNQSGEMRQSKTPLDHCDKDGRNKPSDQSSESGKDDSSDQSGERGKDPVEERDKNKKDKKRR